MDQGYFEWLCEIVDADNPDLPFIGLMKHLYDTYFDTNTAALVPNDDNRIEDGKNLRHIYWEQTGEFVDGTICTMLEMMIALSQRMCDTMGFEDFVPLFWEMIDNLGLMSMSDGLYYEPENIDEVDEIVGIFLNRDYCYDGTGGLFPLKDPPDDQRKTEIWYQMSSYLMENYM